MEAVHVSKQNWAIAQTPAILNDIHRKELNISIYERDVQMLMTEASRLVEEGIEFRASGSVIDIEQYLSELLRERGCLRLFDDIRYLLARFCEVSGASSLRLLLATVNSNMCRKFHTDVNDLRMLCTYLGPGTLWLTEDNIRPEGLDCCGADECIYIDEERIQQAATGAVVILKGSLYPQEGVEAIVHRSPTIEESGAKRLLLRVDTNDLNDLEL